MFDKQICSFGNTENETAVKSSDNEQQSSLKQHPEVATTQKRAEIIEYLCKEVFVKVDRKLGSVHPYYSDIVYPTNYGFLPHTVTSDGEEQDAYILGINEPIEEFKGVVKAIIIRKNDNEDKLVVCSGDYHLTKSEVMEKTNFQEQFFETEIIMCK